MPDLSLGDVIDQAQEEWRIWPDMRTVRPPFHKFLLTRMAENRFAVHAVPRFPVVTQEMVDEHARMHGRTCETEAVLGEHDVLGRPSPAMRETGLRVPVRTPGEERSDG